MTTFLSILQEHLQGFRLGAPGEATGYCPFPHESGKTDAEGGGRSLGINYEQGYWQCFSCHKKGNDVALVAHLLKIPQKKAKQELGYHIDNIKEIPINDVKEVHAALINNQQVLARLKDVRGIIPDTVFRYQLGWNENERRIWIPIRDEYERILNVRRYLFSPQGRISGSDKYVAYKSGFNKARLWPIDDLEALETVYLMEGEMDALLARQLGLPAMTVTAGAGTWEPGFSRALAGRDINICYDCDDAGRQGSQRVATSLLPFAKSVKIVDLALPCKGEDFTDFFIKYGKTLADFKLLVDATSDFKIEVENKDNDTVFEVQLVNASQASMYGKKIKMTAVVAGKDLTPYIFSKRITITCNMNRGQKCQACPIVSSAGVLELHIDGHDDSVLKFIATDDVKRRMEFARRVGIPSCSAWDFTVQEAGNIEEIRLIPEIDYNAADNEYVMRVGYFIGHGLHPNMAYEFMGMAGVNPNNQYAVPILWSAVPVKGSLDDFDLTPELIQNLKVFQVPEDVPAIN